MSRPEPKVATLDSDQLRTLAHPLRSRLLESLRRCGSGTATTLAQRLRTNTGATSYHLRKLADVGLVEDDPGHAGGRDRWWRSAHDYISFAETSFEANADDRAAADWLMAHHERIHSRWIQDWTESRREWSREWREAADSSDYEAHLTAEQLKALNEELAEVLWRYRRESDETLPETQRCVIILHSFPIESQEGSA